MDNRVYFSHRDEKANIYEIQTYLRYISRFFPQIPSVVPDGIFGDETESAIRAFQKMVGAEETGGRLSADHPGF